MFVVTAALSLNRASFAQPAPPEWLFNSGGVFSNFTARPLRYYPDRGDFVIENGAEFFNRPLYCRNGAFRVDGGDKPEFSLYVPGRGGNLRFGVKTSSGVKWLNDVQTVVTRYRPGSLLYEVRDPLLGNGVLHLNVLPLSQADGLIARVELSGASAPVELICAFGGANGMRGRRGGDIGCESEPISRFFQLRPEQCRSNEFVLGANSFLLRSRVANIAGMFSADTSLVIADANQWNSPADLLASPNAAAAEPVVVGRMHLPPAQAVYLALRRVESGSAAPAGFEGDGLKNVFELAEQHRREIAGRVVVETPDPFINAAAAALNVAADAIWDARQQSFMHGAVAWRSRLLGWRGPYAGDALGWHDRTATHFAGFAAQQNTNPIPETIPPADANSNLARNETALHSNGDLTRSHYDMNLVAVDAFFRHLLWTGDLEFARREWPVIERHLAWERRLFRRTFGPDHLPLYEAYNCIWASDNMQFNGGGVTHSSAYNYFHNRMAARVAKLIGKDAAPYEREAELIHAAMQKYLWLADRGWFAEWKDYLGLQLVHPNAGLWTLYHTIDSEVPTPIESWQMTRFVDTQIAHIPIEIRNPKSEIRAEQSLLTSAATEKLFTLPSTSWMPYIWSLNNVVMAEVGHTSLAYWQADRPEAAFALFKGCVLDGMFMGLCPGNVGMSSYFDMARREAQRDFGDAIGVYSRTLVEGLFGVHPDALAGELRIRPGFPADWNTAALRHPDFNFSFQRDGLKENYRIESSFSKPMRLRLQVAALRDGIASVTVNGRPAKWRALEDSVGTPRVDIEAEAGPRSEIVIRWKGEKLARVDAPSVVASGTEIRARFGAAKVREVADPEHTLSGSRTSAGQWRGVASGIVGHRTAFAKLEQGDLKWWEPVPFEIRPASEITASQVQDADHLRFRIRNNTAERLRRDVTIRIGKASVRAPLEAPAYGESVEMTLPAAGQLPGSVPVIVELGRGKTTEGAVTNWKIQAPGDFRAVLSQSSSPGLHAERGAARFEPLDLEPFFNDRVTQIFRNQYVSPRSPFCSLAMPIQGIGGWSEFNTRFDVDDSGLREAANKDNRRFTVQGVPFKTAVDSDAKNILFTSQWDNYPREVSVPMSGRGRHLYLLMAGSSNPMQSRFDNGEVLVTYVDGSIERLTLNNPVNWWPIDQDYFIDDYAFRRPEPIPPRVDLKTGNVRVLDVMDFKARGRRVSGGAATVLDAPLNPEKELKSLTVRALANEVVIGLMAATLAR